MEVERRKLPRNNRQLPVQYRRPGEQLKAAFCANIGVGGLFIFARSPEPVGTKLEILIELPELPQIVQLVAESAYVEGEEMRSGFGVRFVSAPDLWRAHWGV